MTGGGLGDDTRFYVLYLYNQGSTGTRWATAPRSRGSCSSSSSLTASSFASAGAACTTRGCAASGRTRPVDLWWYVPTVASRCCSACGCSRQSRDRAAAGFAFAGESLRGASDRPPPELRPGDAGGRHDAWRGFIDALATRSWSPASWWSRDRSSRRGPRHRLQRLRPRRKPTFADARHDDVPAQVTMIRVHPLPVAQLGRHAPARRPGVLRLPSTSSCTASSSPSFRRPCSRRPGSTAAAGRRPMVIVMPLTRPVVITAVFTFIFTPTTSSCSSTCTSEWRRSRSPSTPSARSSGPRTSIF